MHNPIAQIVVGLPVEGPFDYIVPETWRGRLAVGHRVAVSFGPAKRLGVVVGFLSQSSIPKIKPISAVLDEFPLVSQEALKLARMMSVRYGCTWGEAVELMLPKALRSVRTSDVRPAVRSPLDNKGERVLINSRSIDGYWPEIIKRLNQARAQEQGVIVLVADTAQIPYVMERLRAALPADVIVHDNQRMPKEELAAWKALREGRVNVIVGLRTAVFAPVVSLGSIVMYDEDNPSFSEEQSPYYKTREVVLMRAQLEGCSAVFIGFTPSVEMVQETKENRVSLLEFDGASGPKRQLIDMTNFASKGPMVISFPLRNSLETVLRAGGRSVLVINRRGHSTYTRCLFCGHVMRCDRCSSNLVYSSSKKRNECRQCGAVKEAPKFCPHCKKAYLRSQGAGVERVAQDIRRIFPQARVELFDREIDVFPGRFDILVTTQALLRAFGKLTVECIGVLDIDAEFNRADYGSAHRAYSLLTHLALMTKGSIEIQTFHIDNEVLRHFAAGRDTEFYDHELALRKELRLPPFAHWVSVMLRSVEENTVSNQAAQLYTLMAGSKPAGIEVLNFQPDAVPKKRDQFRFTIFVRGDDAVATLGFVKASIAKLKKKSGVITTVHVDP